MKIYCGIDVVEDKRFDNKINNYKFLEKVFHVSELKELNSKKLAGIFALKEACLKALDINTKNWLNIEIRYKDSGKPYIILNNDIIPKNIISNDCSVSHENGITHAIVIILCLDKKK